MKIILLIFGFTILSSVSFGQYPDLNIKIGNYTFLTKYDTSKFSSTLRIKKGSQTIFKSTSDYPIMDIKEYDLDRNGEKEILIDMYSGGAHCCTYLVATRIVNDKFNFLDTIYWGNSFYSIHDFNDDGKSEILGVNDMFAYAFTNYAQSEYPVLIYGFENNKFKDITKDYPKIIEEDIEHHLEELKLYTTDTGFACPKTTDEDTFNTDAGAVKAILAPIVADYYSLGNVNKGYDFVDSIYKCTDGDKFKEILKIDFKLK